ncbi:hypothetical protein DFJ73DRAFT_859272 [Zopfochytrium polystomum]|nr:hypothetical protein DFJ73DRAFT_859272 [Zopfochytrium polystomum]
MSPSSSSPAPTRRRLLDVVLPVVPHHPTVILQAPRAAAATAAVHSPAAMRLAWRRVRLPLAAAEAAARRSCACQKRSDPCQPSRRTSNKGSSSSCSFSSRSSCKPFIDIRLLPFRPTPPRVIRRRWKRLAMQPRASSAGARLSQHRRRPRHQRIYPPPPHGMAAASVRLLARGLHSSRRRRRPRPPPHRQRLRLLPP